MFQCRQSARLGFGEARLKRVCINQVEASREALELAETIGEGREVLLCSIGQIAKGQKLEIHSIIVVQSDANRLNLLLQSLVAVFLERGEVLEPHPCAQHL